MDNLTKTALAEGSHVAYTAGSCKPNPGPAGCAYLLYAPDGTKIEKVRISLDTTNNIAEMTAVIDALKATPKGAAITIVLTSNYIKQGVEEHLAGWIEREWRKSNGKEVRNKEKWGEVSALLETRQVTFRKVKAHTGDPDNERVDTLAVEAARRAAKEVYIAR